MDSPLAKKTNERSVLSYSGLHFGHLKAHTSMINISKIKYTLVNLLPRNGQPLLRWTRVVSVMLEKSVGNMHAQKLRDILLQEADFNALHKIIFNGKMMPALEVRDEIPSEIMCGRRNQDPTHLDLNKKLIVDISNVGKMKTVSECAEATKCCDRVAHHFSSLYV